MTEKNIQRNHKKQGILNLLFLYTGTVIGLFNSIFKVKVLTPEQIGLLATVTAISILLEYFICFGFPLGIRKFYSIYSKDVHEKTGFILINFIFSFMAFFLTALVFFIFEDRFLKLYHDAFIKQYVEFIYFLLFANFGGKVFRFIYEAEYHSVFANIFHDIIEKIFHLAILLIMFYYKIPFIVFFVVYVIALPYIKLLFLSFFFKKKVKIGKPKLNIFFKKDFLAKYFHYCGFNFLAGVSTRISSNIDKIMIGIYLSIYDVGIYAVITLVSELIEIIGNSFSRIAEPLIAEYWNAEDKNKVKKIYYDAISMQLFLGLFIFIFLNIFANILLGIFGKEYIVGAGVLFFITASHLIDLVSGLSGSVISLSKIYRFDFLTRLFQVILVVITNIIFIPWMGLTGAALATCISVFLFNALKAVIVYKFFKMFPFSVDALKVIFAGAVIWGISLYFRKYINNIFILALFEMVMGIIYFSINFFIFKIDFLKRYAEKSKFMIGRK